MKIITTVILLVILFLFNQELLAQLSYAEGGPSVEDPGLEIDIELRFYVDATNGSDTNDGKSQATAWKTLGKVKDEIGSFIPGSHMLFKRGEVWDEGHLSLQTRPVGEEGKRVVIGAYGNLEYVRPLIKGAVTITTYWMVRDIKARNISIRKGHHSIIYNCIAAGAAGYHVGNGIASIGDCHHTTLIGNLIYDVDNNDAIVLHGRNWATPPDDVGSHHWIVDNISIANQGMEDGIDIAMGDFASKGLPLEGDIKIIANRVQMVAVPGLSEKTGRGALGIAIGKEGEYHWVIGNTVSGGRSNAFALFPDQENFQASGNIVFKGNETEAVLLFGGNINFEYNTVYTYNSLNIPIKIESNTLSFTKNLILRPDGGYWLQKRIAPLEMDYNWWGHSNLPIIDGKSLTEWQTVTGYDLNSDAGEVSGVTPPLADAYNHDPRNWNDQTFLDQFIPSPEFAGLEGIIPGAYDTKGQRQGMVILPFEDSDLANGGLGWEGPLIVQQRLKELGISWGEPLLAKHPSPKDKSQNISISSSLSWEAGDSTISHNVYLGVNVDSLVLLGNQIGTTFDPGTLVYETTYYWQVDEVTSNSTVTGTLWSFTTEEEPIAPTLAVTPSPEDNSIEERTSLLLSWEVGKRTRSSKIYFGISNPPSLITNIEGNKYNPGVLELNTKYYWRVDGVNEWGETEGTVWNFTTEAVASLPEGWASLNIGKIKKSTEDSYENNSFTITASGNGVKGNSDQFGFLYHSLSGDGEIVARVISVSNARSNTFAGVMIRETLDSAAAHHTAGLNVEGVQAKWRFFNGGNTNKKVGSTENVPRWLKIQRVSDYLISSESADGQKWKTLKTEKIKMQSEVQMGLVVTSGDNDSLCIVVFDNLSINGVLVSVEDEAKSMDLIPSEFTISNYPNPFNPTTTIKYSLPKTGKVTIEVYDITGSLIDELLSEKKNVGTHKVIWNGKNRNGLQVSSGIYFYKVQLDDQIKTAKMLFMK